MTVWLREYVNDWPPAKGWLYDTDTGRARRWAPPPDGIDGFGHRCRGGVVAVYRRPSANGVEIVVQQGRSTLPVGHTTRATWSARGCFLSRLRIESAGQTLELRELVFWPVIIPERDWGLEPNFLRWLSGILTNWEEFTAVWKGSGDDAATQTTAP